MRSILVVSDLTPASDGALAAAARLAARAGAALHVAHAMEILGMPLREAVRVDVGGGLFADDAPEPELAAAAD